MVFTSETSSETYLRGTDKGYESSHVFVRQNDSDKIPDNCHCEFHIEAASYGDESGPPLSAKIDISPSLLACDLANLASEARMVLDAGADSLHVDVMDGHFVPNMSWGMPIVKCLHKAVPDAFLDVHMMVSEPEKWIEPMKASGAGRYTFHVEAVAETLSLENMGVVASTNETDGSTDDTNKTPFFPLAVYEKTKQLIEKIKACNMKAGISVKPKTPVSDLEFIECCKLCDLVLVMTVEPGFGGQSFMPGMMPKVEKLRQVLGRDFNIQVDGGLSDKTIDTAAKAGANCIVAGSAVFKKDPPPEKTIRVLRESVEKWGHGK